MESIELNFEEMLEEVQRTKKPIKTYPHIATAFLGVSRRGWRVIDAINALLEKYDLVCEPEFGDAYFYGHIEIKPKPKVPAGKEGSTYMDKDPTPRLSLLKAANLDKVKEEGNGIGLISINKDASVVEATTLMNWHNFSQLPILTGKREVEGIVSWKSIGRALALNKKCTSVMDCKDEVVVLNYDEPLFNAINIVLKNEFVLVRQKDRSISGIVTTTDIGEQFISMAEPFLIIEQIEKHIRKLLDQKFDSAELEFSSSKIEAQKEVKSLSDLTFGQYVRILEDPKKFDKLNLNIDRRFFVKQLESIRKIRNDVMHFSPDVITLENIDLLRQAVVFLQKLAATTK